MTSRKGFTVAECTVALVMLGVILAGLATAMSRLEIAQGEYEARAVATDWASAELDRAAVSARRGDQAKLSIAKPVPQSIRRYLPNAGVTIQSQPLAADGLIRLRSIVEWDGPIGTGKRTVSLVTWVQANQGATP